MPEKQKRLELDGSICIGVLWEGTSLRSCRVNTVLKNPRKDRRNCCMPITPGPLQVQCNRNIVLAVAGSVD